MLGVISPRTLRAAAQVLAAAPALLTVPLYAAHAQAPGQTNGLPPLRAAQPLRLPTVVQKELPNGLKLVILEDHRQPAVWIRLAIGAGSSRDPGDRTGLAQMVAGMLDKGTTTRTETQIADTVDGLGAALGASADEDYLTVAASGLSSYTDNLFDLVADITLHPVFPAQELERARTLTLSGIVSSLGQPATLADAAIHRRVYGSYPYGNFAAGTPASVKAITQQDLTRFHSQLFVPNNATLFLVGDVTADQALAGARARFGSWQRGTPPAPPAPPKAGAGGAPGAQITIVDRPGAEQTEVRIGLLTPGYSDPMRPLGRVASAVLGLGQFEGRLTKEIRVKRGLTYGAASSFDRKANAGIFEISTFTKNVSTGEVVKIALDEARRLQQEATPTTELQERKEFLNGSFAVSVATTPGVVGRLVRAVLYGAGPDDLSRTIPETEAVTSEQIAQYMRSLPLDRPQVVLVGDAAVIEPQVKALGTVTVIPAGSLDLQSPTLMGQAAPADAAPAPGAQADGKSRLAAAVAALGGDAFLNLKTVTLTGSGELSPPGQNMQLPIASATLTFAPPGRSRFELSTGFGDVIFGSDGTGKAWLSALGNIQDAPSGFSDPTELIRRASQQSYEVTTLPDLKDEAGGMLQGIAVKDDKNKTTRVYFDSQTHLPRRIMTQPGEGGLEITLGDYHAAENVKLPGTLKVTQAGKSLVSLKFTAWSINKPVDAKLFARPKA